MIVFLSKWLTVIIFTFKLVHKPLKAVSMDLEIKIRMNENLFIKDPTSTILGKKIVKHAILIINEIGFEDFTFKKLAAEINTTEAGIYRFFENKHRLLVYIITLYWNLVEYQLVSNILPEKNPELRILRIIDLISQEFNSEIYLDEIDPKALFQIVVSESNKVYLTKNVGDNNKVKLFKPYKDLCARIADVFLEFNPDYKFTHSLSSSLIETAHLQFFFMKNLPALTDFNKGSDKLKHAQLKIFLEKLVFSALKND